MVVIIGDSNTTRNFLEVEPVRLPYRNGWAAVKPTAIDNNPPSRHASAPHIPPPIFLCQALLAFATGSIQQYFWTISSREPPTRDHSCGLNISPVEFRSPGSTRPGKMRTDQTLPLAVSEIHSIVRLPCHTTPRRTPGRVSICVASS